MTGTCGHFETGWGVCGATGVRHFLPGLRCSDHTPAALAGRPETVPDPARSMAGLMALERPVDEDRQARYGHATTDPLGRNPPEWQIGRHGLPVKVKGAEAA